MNTSFMLTTTGQMIENKTEKTCNLDDSVLIDVTKIKAIYKI